MLPSQCYNLDFDCVIPVIQIDNHQKYSKVYLSEWEVTWYVFCHFWNCKKKTYSHFGEGLHAYTNIVLNKLSID